MRVERQRPIQSINVSYFSLLVFTFYKAVDSASADKPLGFWKAITLPGFIFSVLSP